MKLLNQLIKTTKWNEVLVIFLFLLLIGGNLSAVSPSDTKPDKTLSFTFNRFYFKDTIRCVECRLSNNTDSVFWILAYDTSLYQGKTYIHALYSLQEKKSGKWKDGDLGFSGVGIERFSLAPGKEFFFETPDFDSTAEAIKIGIEMRRRTSNDKLRTVRTIWTDEINIR